MNQPGQTTARIAAFLKNHPDAVILAFIVISVFGGCAILPFALNDDYGQLLYNVFFWTDWKLDGISTDGRPIASWLVCMGFPFVGSLSGLVILRAVAVLGAGALGLYLLSALKKLGFPRWEALIFVSLALLHPGMGEYVGRTISWPCTFTLLFVAWLSVKLSGWDEKAGAVGMFWKMAGVVLALQAVLLTYQPLAGFLVVIPFLLLFRQRLRPLLFSVAALTIADALYRFIVFPSLHVISPNMGTGTRAQTVALIDSHIADMFSYFLPFNAASWGALYLPLRATTILGLVVFTLAAGGIIALRNSWSGRKLAAAVALALYALVVSAPQVFLLDDVWAYRTHYPMMVLLTLAAWIGVSSWMTECWRNAARWGLLILLFGAAAWSVNVGIVYSANREYVLVRDTLREVRDSGAEKACLLVTPGKVESALPIPLLPHSAYGCISLASAGDNEIGAVAREVWDGKQKPELILLPADQTNATPPAVPVYDLWGRIVGASGNVSTR